MSDSLPFMRPDTAAAVAEVLRRMDAEREPKVPEKREITLPTNLPGDFANAVTETLRRMDESAAKPHRRAKAAPPAFVGHGFDEAIAAALASMGGE